MKKLTRQLHGLQCHSRRSFANADFFKTLAEKGKARQSAQDRRNRLDNTSALNTPQSNTNTGNTKWVTAPMLQQKSSMQPPSQGSIPGAADTSAYIKQYSHQSRNRTYPQTREYTAFQSHPNPTIGAKPKTKEFVGNPNIALTLNDSATGGKRDTLFNSMQENDNHYQKTYTNFLIEHGFVEEEDINEQYEWLQESYDIQYDPDDPYGLRLPPNHKGRNAKAEYTEREQYFGKNFRTEKLEFNHFNKSFILDSCPPMPDRMVHHSPNERNEAPLYLPHISQNIPQWSLKKKIAKTYGPSYMKEITMPPMKLPNESDFQTMLGQFVREKKYKKFAVEMNSEIETENYKNKDIFLEKYLNYRSPNQFIDNGVSSEYLRENLGRKKQLGIGTPFNNEKYDRQNDIVSREYEIWDKDLCYEMKGSGDPKLPLEFKDFVFRQFIDSIDRNGSMAPWQKNYAFSLLPKAFGGPKGQFIEEILAGMAPKEQRLEYKLEKFSGEVGGSDNATLVKDGSAAALDTSGLGL